MEGQDYTRLHITPMTPSLLTILVPNSILASARNISYHTVKTFPENNYGFIDLPQKDADRVRKKFQGCIVQGSKVRIETAQPMSNVLRHSNKPPSPQLSSLETEPVRIGRKAKRPRNELPGVDIGERHVKRGWTIPTHEVKKIGQQQRQTKEPQSKTSMRSKYTTGPECLFKTVLPENLIKNAKSNCSTADKRKGKKSRNILVHEFSNTTKYATFLRDNSKSSYNNINSDLNTSSDNPMTHYIDGKGWFDAHGNLVEEVKRSRGALRPLRNVEKLAKGDREDWSRDRADIAPKLESSSSPSTFQDEEMTCSHSSSSSDEVYHKASLVGDIEKGFDDMELDSKLKMNDEINNDSTDEKSGEENYGDDEEEPESENSQNSSSISATSQNPPITDNHVATPALKPKTNSIHPLASLYKDSESKKSKPQFTFFDPEGEEQHSFSGGPNQIPSQIQSSQTVYDNQSNDFRKAHSPTKPSETPQLYSKTIQESAYDQNIEDGLGNEINDQVKPFPQRYDQQAANNLGNRASEIATGSTSVDMKRDQEESDFQTWFWSNQGQVNRTWKRRRKLVLKDNRSRDNRKK